MAMKYYLAPMEGLTGYVFRNAYYKHFLPMDKYFTPFIASTGLSAREKRDTLPENNVGLNVVPQILTNHVEEFVDIAETMKGLGYKEVNLNLGCPSGTVVSHGRGSGMLRYPDDLARFLDQLFEKSPLPFSIKTRIGLTDEWEWEDLTAMYLKFPMTELIIHPRLQKDFYKKPIHLEAYLESEQAFLEKGIPIVYNGDLFDVASYMRFMEKKPKCEAVMVGRGVLKNPFLTEELTGASENNRTEDGMIQKNTKREKLVSFYHDIYSGYQKELDSEQAIIFKMKEFWTYFGDLYPEKTREKKELLKASSLAILESRAEVIL